MNQKISKYMISVETLEPFRIGAPEDPLISTKNPLSMAGRKIVIPGSSLKGALRSELEGYLIKKYNDNILMKPCIPSSGKGLSEAEKKLINDGIYKSDGSCVFSKKLSSNSICPACYFLGAQGIVGFVRVPYLYTENSAERLYSTRIDRASGVVSEGTNRDYPTVPQGTIFESKVDGNDIPLEIVTKDKVKGWELGKPRAGFNDKWLENSNKWDQKALIKEFIIDRLQAINILGGFKSKGCGRVKIEAKLIP